MSKIIIEIEGGEVVGAYSEKKTLDVIVINRDTIVSSGSSHKLISNTIGQEVKNRLIALPILKIGNKEYRILG